MKTALYVVAVALWLSILVNLVQRDALRNCRAPLFVPSSGEMIEALACGTTYYMRFHGDPQVSFTTAPCSLPERLK